MTSLGYSLHCLYEYMNVVLGSNNTHSNFTFIPLVFRAVPAKTKVFIIAWVTLFSSLLIPVNVLWHQPPRHNYVHPISIVKFVETKTLFQRWKQMTVTGQRILLIPSQLV